MKPCIPYLLLILISPVHAETYDDIVERAFAAIETDLRDHWSYTETTRNDDGLFVARFDPRLGKEDRWELLLVDDRKPTDDETGEFLERKADQNDGDAEDEDSGIETMVSDGSLDLLEESDEHWLFRFRPSADSEDDAKFMDAVEGTLKVEKRGHYVAWIRLRNLEDVKPAKGVKLELFETQLEFAPGYDSGPVLPHRIETRVKGRAMLVIKIDEEEQISYSNFERVID